jgi:hypothetical protein
VVFVELKELRVRTEHCANREVLDAGSPLALA